jgi:L-threonylcarbamoyladenylate synthase
MGYACGTCRMGSDPSSSVVDLQGRCHGVGNLTIAPSTPDKPQAPGMLLNHYATGKRIWLGNLNQLHAQHYDRNIGVLAFKAPLPEIPIERQRILSPKGDLTEAAANVFAYLRELDKLDIDLIIAEPIPNEGIGRAVNDRLYRASGGM